MDWNETATEIITAILRIVGAIDDEEEADAAQYETVFKALNNLIKELQATGIHVWTEEEAILFLQAYQYRYLIGGAASDHCCDAFSYVASELFISANAAATTVTLDDTVGVVSGNQFGVVLDSGVTFWTTLEADPVGNVVTLPDALPGTASAGNAVFSYAANISRPLKIPAARYLTWAGLQETPMQQMARQVYMDLPDKLAPGAPNQFYYSPQLVSGQFFVWQPIRDASYAVRFTYLRSLQDLLLPDQTADFPQEWIDPLTWMCACKVGPTFNWPADVSQEANMRAKAALEVVAGWDNDPEDVQFSYDWDGR